MAQHQPQKQLLQTETELSSFLKRVRQREEDHHRLCDYTSRLLGRRQQLEQSVFISDQIIKNRTFLKERITIDQTNQDSDMALATKCDLSTFQEEENLLARRVVARILQITHAAVETLRQPNDYYSSIHIRFKEICLKIMGQSTTKPSIVVRLCSRYLTQKIQVQLQRLRQAVRCLQISDFQSFFHLKITYYQNLTRKDPLIVQNQKPQISTQAIVTVKKQEIVVNSERQIKNQIRVRPKAKSTKQEQKNRLKLRKMQTKKLKRFVSSICEVMDICREDLLEELSPDNKDWQTKKILGDLVARNRNNQIFINVFLQKESLYQQMVTNPPLFQRKHIDRCQSLEDELLQNSFEVKQQSPEKKISATHKEIRVSEPVLRKRDPILQTKYQKKSNTRVVPGRGYNKNVSSRPRATVNNIEEEENVNKREKQVFSSQKQITPYITDFVEINLKTALPLPRARFPEIAPRISSVDKSSVFKKEQLLRTKLEMKVSSNNFFEEIERRINKFCEMKRNLLV